MTGDDLEAVHAIVYRYGFERHEFWGHIVETWGRDVPHEGPPSHRRLWIMRGAMHGLGYRHHEFLLPFDQLQRDVFESIVGKGEYGAPGDYKNEPFRQPWQKKAP